MITTEESRQNGFPDGIPRNADAREMQTLSRQQNYDPISDFRFEPLWGFHELRELELGRYRNGWPYNYWEIVHLVGSGMYEI